METRRCPGGFVPQGIWTPARSLGSGYSWLGAGRRSRTTRTYAAVPQSRTPMLASTRGVSEPEVSGSAADDAVVVDRAAASATGAAADAALSPPGSAGGVEAALPDPA